GEVREVGNDVVDAGHLVVGKEQAAVDGNDVVARFDEHHVEPDLSQSPQGDQTDGRLVRGVDRERVGSVCGAHGGAPRVPSAPTPAKKGPDVRPARGERHVLRRKVVSDAHFGGPYAVVKYSTMALASASLTGAPNTVTIFVTTACHCLASPRGCITM